MKLRRYFAGAAIVALAVSYYMYKKRQGVKAPTRGGNGKASAKKAAETLGRASRRHAKPRAAHV